MAMGETAGSGVSARGDSDDQQSVNAPLLSQDRHSEASGSRSHHSPPGFCEEDISTPTEIIGTVTDPLEIPVTYTLRGATYKLFRFHLHDWIALLMLVILFIVLNIITPFKRFVGKTMIEDYMYPLQSNTVPTAALPIIDVLIPFMIFVAFFLYTVDITDLHHATLGLLFSVLITAVLTDALKDATGRPRPDFFWRCFPDGIEVFSNSTGNVVCHGDDSVVKEGYKSFPSGHTSCSFAGLGFLSFYLAGKLQLFNGRGHVAKIAVVFTPLLVAMLIGLSRVDDYWHHWQDVFAGAFIGLVMAALCYHEFFPFIFQANSMDPHSYLQIGNNFKLEVVPAFLRRQHGEKSYPAGNGPEHDIENLSSHSNRDTSS